MMWINSGGTCKVVSDEISLVLSEWIFEAPLGVLERLQRIEKRNGKQTYDIFFYDKFKKNLKETLCS